MKILALETNPRRIAEKLVVEGEDVLLIVARHPLQFFLRMSLVSFVTLAGIAAAAFIGSFFVTVTIVLACVAFFLWEAFVQYVGWRFNFLIVTTIKILLVDQWACFRQSIHTEHLTEIGSCSARSQFLGIGHCGSVRLEIGGRERVISSVPQYDLVEGIIDNARVMAQGKTSPPPDEAKRQEEKKLESVKEKADAVNAPAAPDASAERTHAPRQL